MTLTASQRRTLLERARRALTARALGRALPPGLSATDDPGLRRPAGVFVTLKVDGVLRGCVGRIEATDPLPDAVVDIAASAAAEDPRFAPVSIDEVDAVTLEISVLTTPEVCRGPEEVEVGRHGLVVEHGAVRGLLLPQVAVEWGWDRHAFVAHVCTKAGLPADAWRRRATLYRFEAEVFSEER